MDSNSGAQDAPRLTQSARRWLALLKKSLPSPEDLQQKLECIKEGFELENNTNTPIEPTGLKQTCPPCPTGIGRHSQFGSSVGSGNCTKADRNSSSLPDQSTSNLCLMSPGDSTASVAVAALSDTDSMLQQVADESRENPNSRAQSETIPQSLTQGQVQTFRVSVPKGYPGIQYRRSKNLEDRYERYAKRGTVVSGEVEDHGSWLKIGGSVFLPMHVAGLDVLEPASGSEAEAARAEMSKPMSQETYPWLAVFSCGQFSDN
eukprot:TRINITY_DN31230_c0_g1_i1.p1 TRINITY_DN31230_c0_g1~~TRINITY_DN31230_c0_g1_i1.p1  ORF type:complete len:261 (-),score=31.63 TRINITY_DN31230_c0_g1_i1:100-882(-)